MKFFFRNKNCFNMTVYVIIILLTFDLNFIRCAMMKQTPAPWCWTKPVNNDPNFPLPPKGGMNWGFVKPDTTPPPKTYDIEMRTSLRPKSTLDSTNSRIYIKLYGTEGCTGEEILSDNRELNYTPYFGKVNAKKDLGNIFKIQLRIEGEQAVCYRPNKVKVMFDQGMEFSFENMKLICPCDATNLSRCITEMKEEGQNRFEVNLQTVTDHNHGPINVFFKGSTGVSVEKILNEVGKPPNAANGDPYNIFNREIITGDIGEIIGYKLILRDEAHWVPKSLKITNQIDNKEKTFKLDVNELDAHATSECSKNFHSTPEEDQKQYQNSKAQGKHNNWFKGGGNGGGSSSSSGNYAGQYHNEKPPGGAYADAANKDAFEKEVQGKNNPLTAGGGGGANAGSNVGDFSSVSEQMGMQKLKCTDKAVNSGSDQVWGPKFENSQGNFMSVLVWCPHNCSKSSGEVTGIGIHPQDTPICLAGIVDKAISIYGGLMSVNIYSGLSKYQLPGGWNKVGLISIKSSFTQANKSYTLTKVDNVDMQEKDIRILDWKGQLTNDGRVEFRNNGYWGTLCFLNTNAQAAIRICKDLKYNYGYWKNPIEESNDLFCKKYKGEDYCRSNYSKAFYRDLSCDEKDSSFNDCNKKVPDAEDCKPSMDAIIFCTNEDIAAASDSGGDDDVPNYSVRLMGNRKIEEKEVGRLEVYYQQKWGAVCNTNSEFSNESAKVACKSMGFTDGEVYSEGDEFKKDKGSNDPFSAANVKCSGSEEKFDSCSQQNDNVECSSHELDVIIACSGKGDCSGKSQGTPPVNNAPPNSGRMGMELVRADCNLTGQSKKDFRGDPGSSYIIECSTSCVGNHYGSIYGTGVYSSDSSVCLAAVHAGVISSEKGGQAVFTKTWGQKFYEGTMVMGIQSNQRVEDKPTVAFTFSKKYSNHEAYNKLLNGTNLATINQKAVESKSFYEKLLEKAQSFATGVKGGIDKNTEEDMEINHSGQSASSDSKLLIGSDNGSAESSSMGYLAGGFSALGKLSEVTFLELNNASSTTLYQVPEGLNDSEFPPISFKWVESSGTHKFGEFGKIMLKDAVNEQIDQAYTIITVFEMLDFKSVRSFIWSGSDGFNIWLESDTSLCIGDPEEDNKHINTGFKIPKLEKALLHVKYVSKKIYVTLKFQKQTDALEFTKDFVLTIPKQDECAMGCKFKNQQEYFYGDIDLFAIYDGIVEKESCDKAINELECDIKQPDGKKNLPITTDNRKCVSSPTAAATPGKPGSPSPPETAKVEGTNPPTDAEKPAAKDNNVSEGKNEDKYDFMENSSRSYTKFKSSSLNRGILGSVMNKLKRVFSGKGKGKKKKTDEANRQSDDSNQSSLDLNCDDDATGKMFDKQFGKLFRITCGNCLDARYSVFGTENYHPTSSICRSALHMGLWEDKSKLEKKGDILLKIGKAYEAFNGSTKGEKIQSINIGSSDYSFTVQAAPALAMLECVEKGNEGELSQAKENDALLLVCPKNCSKFKNQAKVFGSSTYADNSPICLAAFHDGIIGDQGGQIQVMFSAGLAEYKGTQGFGVKSFAAEEQLRSFTFLGEKSSIYHSYKEKCNGNLLQNWKIIAQDNVENINENSWNCKVDKNWLNKNKVVEPLVAIMHEGTIRQKSTGLFFGSMLKYNYQESEWANGLINVNLLFFDNAGRAGVLFRYQDNNNYYALAFDFTQTENLQLYKVIEGSVNVIKTTRLELNLEIWYRVSIYLDFNNVRITLQEDHVNAEKELFNLGIEGLQRGTLALGIHNMRRIFYEGVQISKWAPGDTKKSQELKRCKIDLIQKNIHLDKRQKFCKKVYKGKPEEVNRCVEPHSFCKLRCDEFINPKMGMANYCCFRTCIASIQNMSTSLDMRKEEWVPKNKDKIDYQPRGENDYVKGVVQKVMDDSSGGKIIQIQYVEGMGESSTVEEKWNSNALNIGKCGKYLTARTDCH